MPKSRVFLDLVTPPTFEIYYCYRMNTKFIYFSLITFIFQVVLSIFIFFIMSFGYTLFCPGYINL